LNGWHQEVVGDLSQRLASLEERRTSESVDPLVMVVAHQLGTAQIRSHAARVEIVDT